MPTISKLQTILIQAEQLHAELHKASLDTIDPAAKNMYTQMTQTVSDISKGLSQRLEQLIQRQATIAQYYQKK
ncbi:DUF1657 domain-containing protein [Fodinisporobacter ferrooxydans]|uniref:DUF1657 domain-containing protein n=1 Tax=Fodinisporobacter ferrooxydans TaxID=2901836 RepID=A0ABY4CP94_9BACL|nr:DUF1657 domain-containing protein [Alicyclobacillaceae bacterium MYW30-H2]